MVRKIVGAVVGIDGMGIAIRVEDKAAKVEVKAGLDWGQAELNMQNFVKLNEALS